MKRYILPFALAAFSLTLASCSSEVKIPEVPAEAAIAPKGPSDLTLTPAQEQQIGLRTDIATVRPFPVTVQSIGQVKPAADHIAHISTPVTGRIVTVSVKLGQRVSPGQVLATLKSDDVGQIEADLLQTILQSDADIRQAKVQLAFSKAAFQREQKLFNDRISAQADLEAARTQYEKDQTTYEALLTKREASIATVQERLSLYGVESGAAAQVVRNRRIDPFIDIISPRAGILLTRSINIGELADPSKELFTVADLSRVKLVADIYEKDIPKIHLGQPVKLTLDSLGLSFPGRIRYVANALDPQTRTLPIYVDVPNPTLTLKPEMFARIEVQVGDAHTLSVPKNALQRSGDYSFAYVPLGNHRYQERRVETGLDDGTYVQIKSGLKAGEPVVTGGTLALQGEALKAAGGIQ